MCMRAFSVQRKLEEGNGLLELDLEMVVSYQMQQIGTKFGSTARPTDNKFKDLFDLFISQTVKMCKERT